MSIKGIVAMRIYRRRELRGSIIICRVRKGSESAGTQGYQQWKLAGGKLVVNFHSASSTSIREDSVSRGRRMAGKEGGTSYVIYRTQGLK